MGDFKISLVTKEDEPAALEHLRENFCKDEPILNYLKPKDPTESFDSFLDVIRDGISLKAVDKNGKIVGLFLNKLIKKNKAPKPNASGPPKSKEFQTLSAVLDYAYGLVNVFELYPNITEYIDGTILSVDSSCRGQGLGRKLTEALFDLAKSKNINVINIFCSSLYTYQICSKFGFKKVAEKPYRDMKLGGTHPPLDFPEPHTAAYIVIKEL